MKFESIERENGGEKNRLIREILCKWKVEIWKKRKKIDIKYKD